MRFSEILEVSVPDTNGTTAIGFGDTFTKERFEIVLGQNNDYQTLQKQVAAPGKTTYLYQVRPPSDF
jgi:hypothetical protein